MSPVEKMIRIGEYRIDRARYEELLQALRVMRVTLGIGMCVALLMVMRFVFGTAIGLPTAGVLAVVWVGLWYVFPFQLRRRGD